jgi:hypothetical protein
MAGLAADAVLERELLAPLLEGDVVGVTTETQVRLVRRIRQPELFGDPPGGLFE